MIAIRVDVDTVRDARMVPLTLDLLKKYDMRASFFITTGIDETYRNYRRYLNLLRLLSSRAHIRYGLDMFQGIIFKRDVQLSKGLSAIIEGGHELGLHGYCHYDWMNSLNGKTKREIEDWISKGCELFEDAFGFFPECFAAPGFKTSEAFLFALDDFGFRYSSDFIGNKSFHPSLNGSKMKTTQLPVSLYLGDGSHESFIKILKRQIEEGYCVFYFHPSYEPVFHKRVLEKVLNLVSEKAVPLGGLLR